MNLITISGRITKDIELSTTPTGTKLTRFNVAVASELKDGNGERKADFFPCIAWRETAETLGKYFKKGSPIEIFGSMNSRTYKDKNSGENKIIWEINVKGWNFPPLNKDDQETSETPKTKSNKSKKEELTPLDDDETDDLPF